jgi:parvulin-like peptidyl-prolyl isomerase
MKAIQLFIYLLAFLAQAQTTNSILQNVNNIEDAEYNAKKFVNLGGMVFKVAPELKVEEGDEVFLNKRVGDTIHLQRFIFKIIDKAQVNAYRVSYVFFDATKKSMQEIDSIRNEILVSYKKGVNFQTLARKYTMDSNTNGEINWVTYGQMYPEFETKIKQHKKGDIFSVDILSEKWYYIVLKTYEDTTVDELTIFRIRSGI